MTWSHQTNLLNSSILGLLMIGRLDRMHRSIAPHSMRENWCDGKVRYTHLWIKPNWKRPTNYIFAIFYGTASLEKFPQFSGDLRQIDAMTAEMNLRSLNFFGSHLVRLEPTTCSLRISSRWAPPDRRWSEPYSSMRRNTSGSNLPDGSKRLSSDSATPAWYLRANSSGSNGIPGIFFPS
jgi:hypothetical protein